MAPSNTHASDKANKTSAVLLVNLGTPQAPDTAAVAQYLEEFLSDRRVIDIPRVPRWLLLQLAILPIRSPKSAEAYKSIWTEEGSPLLVHTRALAEAVQKKLANCRVAFAMRYGEPSIEKALHELLDASPALPCDELVVMPLYPQYAASTTGSSLAKVYEVLGQGWDVPNIRVIPPFYDHHAFIDASAAVAKAHLDEFQPDHLLLSYHGLPERHIHKSASQTGHCLQTNCCDQIDLRNKNCYRAHCFATSRALLNALKFPAEKSSTTFQSRLGRTVWIQPYTEDKIRELAKQGTKKLAVLCPSFVADCLETLEEIQIRGQEVFQEAGGDELRLIPSLNSDPHWIDAVVRLLGC